MKKVFLFFSVLLAFALFFSFSAVYAANGKDATGAIRNTATATANTVKNSASAAANTVRSATANVRNTATDYTATMTSATEPVKIAGMTADGWAWFIVAALGICVVMLVWYYGQQKFHSHTIKDLDNK